MLEMESRATSGTIFFFFVPRFKHVSLSRVLNWPRVVRLVIRFDVGLG